MTYGRSARDETPLVFGRLPVASNEQPRGIRVDLFTRLLADRGVHAVRRDSRGRRQPPAHARACCGAQSIAERRWHCSPSWDCQAIRSRIWRFKMRCWMPLKPPSPSSSRRVAPCVRYSLPVRRCAPRENCSTARWSFMRARYSESCRRRICPITVSSTKSGAMRRSPVPRCSPISPPATRRLATPTFAGSCVHRHARSVVDSSFDPTYDHIRALGHFVSRSS